MKVRLQQISTGLYWKDEIGWVVEAEDADVFGNSTEAILFCTKHEMRDVRIILSFDDPQFDVALHPFGEKGHEPTSSELIEKSRNLKEASQLKVYDARRVVSGVHQTVAALKELQKKLPFPRKKIGE